MKNSKLETMEYNTYENNLNVYGDFELPVPTYIFNKKIDFKIIVAMILRSNANIDKDTYRYLDASKFNKDEVCRECNISRKVLNNKIKYLKEIGIISTKNSNRGLVYIINYSKCSRYYVTIPHKFLKTLYDTLDSDTLKVYIILLVQCKYLNNKRPMSNAYICSQLGYSINATNNLGKIGQCTSKLHDLGFIKKRKELIYKQNKDGKSIIQSTNTYYTINDFYLENS